MFKMGDYYSVLSYCTSFIISKYHVQLVKMILLFKAAAKRNGPGNIQDKGLELASWTFDHMLVIYQGRCQFIAVRDSKGIAKIDRVGN